MEKPEILYEDSQILVCVKPAGFPVQTKHTGTMDLEHYLKNHLLHQSVKTASGSKKPALCSMQRRKHRSRRPCWRNCWQVIPADEKA